MTHLHGRATARIFVKGEWRAPNVQPLSKIVVQPNTFVAFDPKFEVLPGTK